MPDHKWPAPEDGEKGWQPDPAEEGSLRYWDGENWTEQVREPEKVSAPEDLEKGWKPDPTAEGQRLKRLRYWDGEKWTQHIHQPEKQSSGSDKAAQEPAGKKPGFLGWWAGLPIAVKILLPVAVVIVVIVAAASDDTSDDKAASTSGKGIQPIKSQGGNGGQTGGGGAKENAAGANKAQNESAVPPEPEEPEMTPGQENALRSAEDYLDYAGFSKAGLIDQLSSSAGDGFSKADATFAANNVDVDWNGEAVESAKDYLDYTSFSKAGLIDQLSSSAGDQFTPEQAQYGADKAYPGG